MPRKKKYKKQEIEYTFPHMYKPRGYQIPLMNALIHKEIPSEDSINFSGVKRAVCVLPRRHGKDITAWHIIIREALQRKGTYHYCFPTYSQAKKAIWDAITNDGISFLDFLPKGLVLAMNQQEMKITLFNGSILQLIGTENIDSIRGTNPVGVVFSEYAYMSHDILGVYSPIMLGNGGWMLFISTPNGKNHFYDLYIRAKNEVKDGNKDWFVQHQSAYQLGIMSEENLNEEKKRMPAALFSQEYECKFVDGASQFFKNIRENTYDVTSNNSYPKKNAEYQIGVDLGKANDYTVLTAIDMSTFQVLPQDQFNKIAYPEQKARIEAYWYRHNEGTLYLDKTGVGESVSDDLALIISNLVPCHFHEKFRNDILNNLRILLEQGRIKIPNDEELLNQLEAFQYTFTQSGKTRVAVPDSQHDDRVMSLALAVQEMPENTIPLYLKQKQSYNGDSNAFTYLDD